MDRWSISFIMDCKYKKLVEYEVRIPKIEKVNVSLTRGQSKMIKWLFK